MLFSRYLDQIPPSLLRLLVLESASPDLIFRPTSGPYFQSENFRRSESDPLARDQKWLLVGWASELQNLKWPCAKKNSGQWSKDLKCYLLLRCQFSLTSDVCTWFIYSRYQKIFKKFFVQFPRALKNQNCHFYLTETKIILNKVNFCSKRSISLLTREGVVGGFPEGWVWPSNNARCIFILQCHLYRRAPNKTEIFASYWATLEWYSWSRFTNIAVTHFFMWNSVVTHE